MRKLDVKEGKNWLQVIDCNLGRSSRTGNPYWRIKCNVLPKPGEKNLATYPFGSFSVYFMQNQPWALENLKAIAAVCGAATPVDLIGKCFIADVAIKNDFVSLKNPRPFTTEEEPEPEPAGINSPSEWPW